MPVLFKPTEELLLFCRYCKKATASFLERSIAGSGKTVNKDSTFEFICSKCNRSTCYFGNDLTPLEKDTSTEKEQTEEEEVREYDLNEHFLIGEKIQHPSHDNPGIIVGKEQGVPSTLLVKFEKKIFKLVENVSK